MVSGKSPNHLTIISFAFAKTGEEAKWESQNRECSNSFDVHYTETEETINYAYLAPDRV